MKTAPPMKRTKYNFPIHLFGYDQGAHPMNQVQGFHKRKMAIVLKPLIRKLIIDFLAALFSLKLLLKDTAFQHEGIGAVCWKSICAVFHQYFFQLSYGLLLWVIRLKLIMENGGRQGNGNLTKKSFFIFLAIASIVLAMLCLQKTTFYNRWLNEGLTEEWKLARDFIQLFSIASYVSCLVHISFYRRANPIRLGPRVKFAIDGGFVLICLAISKYFDDLPSAILYLSLCFHIIPVAQLFFDAEDYGVFDTLLALCLETTLHLHKYEKAAPFAVIFLSFGMQAVKNYSAAGRGGRAQGRRDVEE